MQKANRIALPILAIVICGFLAWRFWPQPEPTYKGKSLTTWLEYYAISGAVTESMNEEAREAVRHIGTNGIPVLLRRLRAAPYPPLKAKLIHLAQKLELLRKDYHDEITLNAQGEFGFTVLGAVAMNAAPQLLVIYEQNISRYSQQCAGSSLVASGSPTAIMAIPLTIRRATNSHLSMRAHAIYMLSTFHDHPDLVMPYLTNALYDSSQEIRRQTLMLLKDFGEKAKSAVPRLLEMVNDPDDLICLDSIRLLGSIHAEPNLVVPALIKLLCDGNKAAAFQLYTKSKFVEEASEDQCNNIVRWSAAVALSKFGEKAKPAVPVLLKIHKEGDLRFSSSILAALRLIDPEAVPKKTLK